MDYDIFVNVPRLDAQDLKKVQWLYKAEDFDFRLKPGSAAIDRGVVLPNMTDGFTGPRPISARWNLASLHRTMAHDRSRGEVRERTDADMLSRADGLSCVGSQV